MLRVWTWPDAELPARVVIDELELQPLPREGGYFRSTGRTARLSSILFLLTNTIKGFSAMHCLDVEEGWQWLAGAEAELVTLCGDSAVSRTLGADPVIVPAGTWQGARTTGRWTLVSCWCTPAFTDDVCTFGERADLLRRYPAAAAAIHTLTRD